MIPEQLQNKDFRFILIKPKQKIPLEKSWQQDNNYAYDHPKLLKHLEQGGNYGVLCGKGGLVVIDFDDEETQQELLDQIPKTFTVRTGSGLYHKYYFLQNMIPKMPIKNDKQETLFDIQAEGSQVIGPNSTHPNGNKYIIVDPSPISYIADNKLAEIIGKYATKTAPTAQVATKNGITPGTITQDQIVLQIKNKIRVSDLMNELGFDTSKNPTACIFHPSKGGQNFSYDDSKGLWHCFHCGKSGDVIKLFMEHYETKFKEAKQELGSRLGLVKRLEKKINGLKLDNYVENVSIYYESQPFFYDKQGMFWFWNKELYKWEIVDETDVLKGIDQELSFGGSVVTKGIRGNYLEAFKYVGRGKIPLPAPKSWVQFKDTIMDISTGEKRQATPEYLICNPIPWKMGMTTSTPVIDKLISEWVGPQNKEKLYEIIAYCCYADYPIHLIFGLIGCGRNGKSSFLRLLFNFLGTDNITSTELDSLLESRFESVKLYKKLACVMGETNFGVLNKTSLIKRLCGQDMIGFEFKQKKPFDDYNYAKIIISSNSLPTSSDTSDGFYRRWHIIEFKNEFEEGKDIISRIPLEEYESLAAKVVEILPDIIKMGGFTNQGSIKDRVDNYIKFSNPLRLFIEELYEKDINGWVRYSELYMDYVRYLNDNKKRVVGYKEFSSGLLNMGLEKIKMSRISNGEMVNAWWIVGISKNTGMTKVTGFPTHSSYKGTKSEYSHSGNTSHLTDNSIYNNITSELDDVFSAIPFTNPGRCVVCGKETLSENIDLCEECGNENIQTG